MKVSELITELLKMDQEKEAVLSFDSQFYAVENVNLVTEAGIVFYTLANKMKEMDQVVLID